MKALVQRGYRDIDVYQFEECPVPAPGPREIIVKVVATAINDWELGVLNIPLLLRPLLGLRAPRGRFRVMGCDMSGIVEAVGGEVTRFKPGDEVYGDLSGYRFGGFAEFARTIEKHLIHKPAALSFAQAAALPHAADLALAGLAAAPALQAGQTVLINGAGGGVGTLLIQILSELDVEVTGVDRVEKHALLKTLGYHHVIAWPEVDFTRTGKRYDFILDVKTDLRAWDYLRALKPGGLYATVGGERLFRYMFTALLAKPFTGRRLKIVSQKPNKHLGRINELVEAGKLTPVIDQVFPFTDIHAAIKRFKSGEHQGKIIVSLV